MNRVLAVLSLVLLAAAPALADPPEYASQIAPIFKTYCTSCHNADDRDGKLVLERYAALLEGGEHGAVVVPGKSAESRLIQVLTGKAKPVAKSHYYVSQDASTKACSVVTKKPNGTTATMVGKYWYSSKAKANAAMKKAAACKGA